MLALLLIIISVILLAGAVVFRDLVKLSWILAVLGLVLALVDLVLQFVHV